MLVAAIAYNYTFTYKDYMRVRYKRSRRPGESLASTEAPSSAHSRQGVYGDSPTRHWEELGDGPLSLSDQSDEGHFDNAGDLETETERKPFLSAFLQSSVPDDVMRDIR